jgi:S-adenosylmethionine:tRNA ribosyltransferase-isomerase
MANPDLDDLKLSSYDFHLPKDLIANWPNPIRHQSQLMIYDVNLNNINHSQFIDLPKYLPSDCLLVFNQTKVLKAKLRGIRPSGGAVEILLTEILSGNRAHGLVKASGKRHIGEVFILDNGCKVQIETKGEKGELEDPDKNGTYQLSFFNQEIMALLEEIGQIPLPPYIRGGRAEKEDEKQYQTIYSREEGAIAAPTAGLHFSKEVFSKLKENGIEVAFLTLHVGVGTFFPVKCEDISKHKMHQEKFFIDERNLSIITKARQNGKKIISVGTTTLRALESIYRLSDGQFEIIPNKIYSSELFLYPGKKVCSVSGLITNFHLPKSTLLMLVSALIGRKKLMHLYRIAIENQYRFFSYGDAMLLLSDGGEN